MIPATLITPPSPVISAADAKLHSPALANVPDARLEAMIAAATAQLDGPYGMLKRCIGRQTWRQPYSDAADPYRLPPFGEVQVKKVLVGTDEVPSGEYQVGQDALGVWVKCSAPVTHIDFEAGFTVVPENIRMAIVLIVTDIESKASGSAALRSVEVEGVATEQYSNPDVMSAATTRTVQALLGRHMGITYA